MEREDGPPEDAKAETEAESQRPTALCQSETVLLLSLFIPRPTPHMLNVHPNFPITHALPFIIIFLFVCFGILSYILYVRVYIFDEFIFLT